MKILKIFNSHSHTMKNGMWMYLMQAFNTIIPLLTIPYITRVLGKTQYGTFSVALNIITYLQVLVEYGFVMSASREIVINEDNPSKISNIFSNVLYGRFFLYFLSIIAVIVYMFINRSDYILCICSLSLLLCLLGYVVQQNWLFQGKQDMKYISLVNIVGRVVSVILIFILVKSREDVVLYAILYSISPLLSGFIGLIVAIKKYNLHLYKPDVGQIIDELKNGFYVFTTSLSAKVFGAIGVTILGVLSTKDVVGCFSAIQKIPSIMMLAWSPISQILYPISSKKMTVSFSTGYRFVKKVEKNIFPLFFIVSIIISLFCVPIVNVAFGDEYVENAIWIVPLLVWVLLGINNNFLGIQILLSSGNDRTYSKCFQLSVVFTVISNGLLIYLFGGLGAALAPMISELFLSILLTKEVRRLRLIMPE